MDKRKRLDRLEHRVNADAQPPFIIVVFGDDDHGGGRRGGEPGPGVIEVEVNCDEQAQTTG
jgi:hypothetical protein